MNFFKGLFGGQTQIQQNKFQKFIFTIEPQQNLPKIQSIFQYYYEQQFVFDQHHPMYKQVFRKEQSKQIKNQQQAQTNYTTYVTQLDDTLIGLSFKFDIPSQKIKNMNDISGNQIFPGMKIKLPKGLHPLITSQQSLQQIPNLNNKSPENVSLFLLDQVLYSVGTAGKITGIMIINHNYIMFNPDLDDSQNLALYQSTYRLQDQKLIRFNAIIQMDDIKQIKVLQFNTQPIQFAIQFLLFSVGNKKIQKKYRQKLKQLRQNKKPIASIFFILKYQTQQQSRKQQLDLAEKINSYLNEKDKLHKQPQKQSLTNLPYFDIMYQSIGGKQKTNLSVWDILKFKPKMTDKSDFLTQQTFLSIMESVPNLFKMTDWYLLYSPYRDGTSLNRQLIIISMLRLAQKIQPTLIIIKQLNGYIFGVYCTDQLRLAYDQIFGKGQMFLFTNKFDNKFRSYIWTQKNNFFMLINQQGIAIGMGQFYGLYIKSDFQNGSSNTTYTFDSPQLSKQRQFQIQFIEVLYLYRFGHHSFDNLQIFIHNSNLSNIAMKSFQFIVVFDTQYFAISYIISSSLIYPRIFVRILLDDRQSRKPPFNPSFQSKSLAKSFISAMSQVDFSLLFKDFEKIFQIPLCLYKKNLLNFYFLQYAFKCFVK